MFLDDPHTQRREHVLIELGAGFQVLGNNPNMVKHGAPVTGFERAAIAGRAPDYNSTATRQATR